MSATGFHITGACSAAYARGCRCTECRQAWRRAARKSRGAKPSLLALEVEELRTLVDRLYREIDWLHGELDREQNS